MSEQSLVLCDRMRLSIQQCARIDEAKEIRDQAEALAYYARQRDDRQLDIWMSEIRLRAVIRIGETAATWRRHTRSDKDRKFNFPPMGSRKSSN
jgi:hypothetical protein